MSAPPFATRLAHFRNTLRDRLGLPVTFSDAEAALVKQHMSTRDVAAARCAQLARLFGVTETSIADSVREAEALALAGERDRVERERVHLASPMSTDDSVSLYAVVRASRPRIAVETGTAAGASALYVLRAMEANGDAGQLHSIDLVDDPQSIGMLIPPGSRARVRFHRGDSLAILPRLLAEIGPIDLFLHDSHHAYEHMTAEYEIALRHLKPGGILASHDVLHSNAWRHFLRRHGIERSTEIRNFGICVVP